MRAETACSTDPPTRPRRVATSTRDANDSDEAAHRRYNRRHLRFDRPGPYDGSYDLTEGSVRLNPFDQ